MMGVYPPGSTVQLTDDRYALVVAVNSARPLKPNVLVHDAATPRDDALVLDLETAAGLGIRRSVRAAAAAADRARLPVAGRARQPTSSSRRWRPTTTSEQPASGRPVQRRRGGASHLAGADRGDARGGLPGRARGPAHRRRQRRRRPPARPAAGRAGRPRHARDRADARGRVRSGSASATRAAAPASSPTRTSPAPAARRCRSCAASAGSSRRRATRSTSSPWSTAASRCGSRTRVAVGTAELAATLESVADGVLVVDLAGHISHFNRRFAALWELPDEMLLLRADDEVFDWMRQRVADPASYMRRLAEIDDETMLRATDTLGAALGRRARAGDAAAAEPGPADRPRVLVPGRRRRRFLRPAARAGRAGCSARLSLPVWRPRDLAKVRAFTTTRNATMSAIAGALEQRLGSLSLPSPSFCPAAGASAARTPP